MPCFSAAMISRYNTDLVCPPSTPKPDHPSWTIARRQGCGFHTSRFPHQRSLGSQDCIIRRPSMHLSCICATPVVPGVGDPVQLSKLKARGVDFVALPQLNGLACYSACIRVQTLRHLSKSKENEYMRCERGSLTSPPGWTEKSFSVIRPEYQLCTYSTVILSLNVGCVIGRFQAPRSRNQKADRQTQNSTKLMLEGKNSLIFDI